MFKNYCKSIYTFSLFVKNYKLRFLNIENFLMRLQLPAAIFQAFVQISL